MFWSRNIFCFLDGRELTSTVGRVLLPPRRANIRSISIMNPDRTGFTSPIHGSRGPRGRLLSALWNVLWECTGLEMLEIPPIYIKSFASTDILSRKLARLRYLRLTQLLPYGSNNSIYEYPYPSPNLCEYPTVYGRFSHQLNLNNFKHNAPAELCRELETTVRTEVDIVIKVQFLGAEPDRRCDWKKTISVAPILWRRNKCYYISTLTGATFMVTFYGLPTIGAEIS